jgi:membrane protein DedA with SNARE-associated domain
MDGVGGVLIRYGYCVVFGAVLAEQIGLPMPAIPFLLAAGGLAGTGRLSAVLVLALAGAASLAADAVWYSIGRRRGARVLGWLCRISLEPDSCVGRTERTFARHGARSLLVVAKFIPGLSTIAPPLSGIVRMPIGQFLVFTGLGGVIWAGAFVTIGWLFSHQLEVTAAYVARFGSWTVALLAATLGGYIAWKYIVRQRCLRNLRIARITPEELKTRLDRGEDVIVVDVRDRIDFEADPSMIPGSLHLTIDELDARHQEIPRGHETVLYCT